MVLSSLFGCTVGLVSGIATKAAIVLSMFSFTNCYGYSFMLIFLKLMILFNAVEYRHKYLNMQHISIRKILCFIVYKSTSPEEPPSVTSGSRVSVQQASPIRLLYERLPKVYVFSAHKMFTTFCAPFPIRISHFKILAMPQVYMLCSLLTRSQGSLAFSVV